MDQRSINGGNVTHAAEQPQAGQFTGFCTYRDWLRQRLDRDMVGDFTPVRVQTLRRGLKSCAVVVEAELGDGSQDWFRVRLDGEQRLSWLPSSKVRMCSGDGRCSCERAAEEAAGFGRACEAIPAASDVPPGNTGTTVVEVA